MAKRKRKRTKVIATVKTVATTKAKSNLLGTVLIVGGIGLAAYVITRAMPKLPEVPEWLGGGGGSSFDPVISLPSIGGSTAAGSGGGCSPYEQAQQDFESRARPTLPWQDPAPVTPSEWDQFKAWWEGQTPLDQPVVTQPQPHIIQTTPLKAVNIGGEIFWGIPQVPGLNVTWGEHIWEGVKGAFLGSIFPPLGLKNSLETLSNVLRFGYPWVEVVPDADVIWPEMPGQADAPPVCEGQAAATASGFKPFFIPGGCGAEEPVKSEAPAKATRRAPTRAPRPAPTPWVNAPAAPVIRGGGGQKKELYIL